MFSNQTKNCPRCGAAFECCGNTDCWCEHIQVQPRAIKYAMLHYADCLCENCLKAIDNDA